MLATAQNRKQAQALPLHGLHYWRDAKICVVFENPFGINKHELSWVVVPGDAVEGAFFFP